MQATQQVKLTPGPPPTFAITNALSRLEDPDPHPPSKDPSPKRTRTDPLLMFGILTPPILRQAQSSAIELVEEIIPRLASVDAEMREAEIGIRRARKHFARKGKGGMEMSTVKEGGLKVVVT